MEHCSSLNIEMCLSFWINWEEFGTMKGIIHYGNRRRWGYKTKTEGFCSILMQLWAAFYIYVLIWCTLGIWLVCHYSGKHKNIYTHLCVYVSINVWRKFALRRSLLVTSHSEEKIQVLKAISQLRRIPLSVGQRWTKD